MRAGFGKKKPPENKFYLNLKEFKSGNKPEKLAYFKKGQRPFD